MTLVMAMTDQSPWGVIRRPEGNDVNIRRVRDTTHALYWGKDAHGNALFIVHLEGDHREWYAGNRIDVQGIQTELAASTGPKESHRLVLSLVDRSDKELFQAFCEGLVSMICDVTDGRGRLSLTFDHLRRWKAFMASGRKSGLSPIEVVGLYAELLFLEELLDQGSSEQGAIDAWLGPEAVHQDFVFGNTAIEVKSVTGRDPSVIRIASEDQMETVCDRLFLRVYRLSPQGGSPNELSLNGLVVKIQATLKEPGSVHLFREKLSVAGYYFELPEYSKPFYVVLGSDTYLIDEEFPRLVRSKIPAGIVRVSYSIQLENIRPFRREAGQIWEGER